MATGAERGDTGWTRLPSTVEIAGQVEKAQAGSRCREWSLLLRLERFAQAGRSVIGKTCSGLGEASWARIPARLGGRHRQVSPAEVGIGPCSRVQLLLTKL